jgi:hypothetical protein
MAAEPGVTGHILTRRKAATVLERPPRGACVDQRLSRRECANRVECEGFRKPPRIDVWDRQLSCGLQLIYLRVQQLRG